MPQIPPHTFCKAVAKDGLLLKASWPRLWTCLEVARWEASRWFVFWVQEQFCILSKDKDRKQKLQIWMCSGLSVLWTAARMSIYKIIEI